MDRSLAPEILDDSCLPEETKEHAYRDLTRVHGWLRNTATILRALEQDSLPVRRVLDIGCAYGELLLEVRKKLGAEVVGYDLHPPKSRGSSIPILQGDAVHEPLPPSDVAIAVCLAHHLSEPELIALIRNVGRSCRRLILLDPVRHWLPLMLFRIFLGPFLHPVTAADGRQSIRRSFTPAELSAVVRRALAGTGAKFTHSVAPLFARQIVDISYVG